jgi:lysophospholipase L1-like esterase
MRLLPSSAHRFERSGRHASPFHRQMVTCAGATAFIVAMLEFGSPAGYCATSPGLRFAFGGSPPAPWILVKPSDVYNVNRGYGFDLGSEVEFVQPTQRSGSPLKTHVTGAHGRPFFFSTRIDPGVYRVSVTLGGSDRESITTVKSETRRLMLESVHVAAGETKIFTFDVHVRSPWLPNGEHVHLKPREQEPILYVQWDPAAKSPLIPFLELDWDEKLTLEFSDRNPAVCAVEIAPDRSARKLLIAGDSTATDQMMEPAAAWGQMLPRWFQPPIVVANYAECGSTAAGFIRDRRWEKMLSEMRAGDVVLIEFGINDRRAPVSEFTASLRQMVTEARGAEAIPVLVTPQQLRSGFFDAQAQPPATLGEFPPAIRGVARELGVPLVDLYATSTTLYGVVGPSKLPAAFIDGAHHTTWGAYLLAQCVLQACIDLSLPCARHILPDWAHFDPAQPLPFDQFHLPPDPQLDPARPGGPGTPDGRGMMAGAVETKRGRSAP